MSVASTEQDNIGGVAELVPYFTRPLPFTKRFLGELHIIQVSLLLLALVRLEIQRAKEILLPSNHTCMESVLPQQIVHFTIHFMQVEFHDESPGQQKDPGVPYKIQLSATPGTRVGLLAVDQSVYILRNREKLNKKRVGKFHVV